MCLTEAIRVHYDHLLQLPLHVTHKISLYKVLLKADLPLEKKILGLNLFNDEKL